tara:strand:+ start:79 stop:660 length:582 start_codon:yes stop_codon:yes gene_type:complete
MPTTEPGKQDNLKIPFYFKGTPFKLRSQSPAKQLPGDADIITPNGPGLVDIKYGGENKDASITNKAAESVSADSDYMAKIEEGDDAFAGGGFGDTSGAAGEALGQALTSDVDDVGIEQQKFRDIAGDGEETNEFRSDLQSRIDNANTPQKKQRLQDRMDRKEQKDKVKAKKQTKKGEKKMKNLNKKKGGKWKM